MAIEVSLTDNSDEILNALEEQVEAALEAVGNQAVSYAKQNIASAGRVNTGALQNSISHLVMDKDVYVGTNQSYATFNEVGTGIYAEGGGGRQTPWAYQDGAGNWHMTRGMKAIHFLKDAVANNIDTFRAIIQRYLKGG